MKYEQFVKYMENIKALYDAEKKLGVLLTPYTETYIFQIDENLQSNMIHLLEELMVIENEDIFYYAYECDWGEASRKVIFKDGKEFIMDSYKSLWDSLHYKPQEQEEI